jgi:preprotein translocase subunit SecF
MSASSSGRGPGPVPGHGDGDSDSADPGNDLTDDMDDIDETDDTDTDNGVLGVDDAARNLMSRRPRRAPRPGRSSLPSGHSSQPGQPSHHGPLARLYRGETRFDFVGRRRWWYLFSAVIIALGVLSIVLRGGLNLGIEFKGGTEWTVRAPNVTQTQAVNAMEAAGLNSPIVELLGRGSSQSLNVQANLNKLSPAAQSAEENRVEKAIAQLTHTSVTNVTNNRQQVGPTWGSQITNKAIEALIIFFVVVAAYISIRFEPKMALAAFVAMIHDILVTVGVYSLFNFQVTPDTVVAVLTILGYSLYDTVVVFDRVRDNNKGIGTSGRMSYTQIVNLSMNQTLARSINTSLVAILPVLAVLVVGAQLLGAVTLQNFGLALFVGLLSGAYSSIFIAAPVLATLKEREPKWVAIAQRIATRGDRVGALSPQAAADMSTQMSISAGGQQRGGGSGPAKRSGPIRPGSATGSGAGPGTAAMNGPGGGGQAAPRPRKGKGKRKS